jgi:nucleolar protein 15
VRGASWVPVSPSRPSARADSLIQVVPSEEVHPQLWVGANKKFRKIPRARVEKMKHDKVSQDRLSIRLVGNGANRRSLMTIAQPRTKQEQEQANKRVLEKQAGRRKKIKDAGIDYDFEGHVSDVCCRSSSSGDPD